MSAITSSFDKNFYEFIDDVKSLTSKNELLQQEFLDIVIKATLHLLREATPKDKGDLADSWKVFSRGTKFVVIGTELEDVFLAVVNGQRPYIQKSKTPGKKLHFFIGDQEFFRLQVSHKRTVGNDYITPLIDGLDKLLEVLMLSLVKRYWRVFKDLPVPDINVNNVTKTVGLTGTTFSRLRGRGRGIRRPLTGRKRFGRRLSRRRRTGHFITSKDVKVG